MFSAQSLLCPISSERVNQHTVRLTAGIIASLVVVYLVTGWWPIPVALVVDFALRGITSGSASPLRALAARVAPLAGPPILIDKAPKIFAARVGLVFSASIVAASLVSPLAAQIIAAVLLVFALLESLLNICAGCLVYTYVVVPFFQRGTKVRGAP